MRDIKALEEFTRQDAARLQRDLTPAKALRLFEAMWQRAQAQGALRRADPLEGLELEIEVARLINSLPRGADV